MSSQGVVLYNWGLPCVPRLFVALRSLRRHYKGPVTVMAPQGDITAVKYKDDILREGADFLEFPVPLPWFPELKVTAKLWVLRASPYARTVVYENDFLFRGSPEPIFDLCASTGFGICRYHGQQGTTRGTAYLARRQWRDWPGLPALMGPDTRSYNHGMIYMAAGHPFLEEWGLLMERWGKWTFAEEHIANVWCNLRLGEIGTTWTEVPEIYNLGMKFARNRDLRVATALHYIKSRHLHAAQMNSSRKLWRRAFRKLCTKNPPRCLQEMLTWEPELSTQIVAAGGVEHLW